MEVEKKNLLNPEVPLNEAEAQKSYGAAPEYQSTQPTIVYAPAPQQAPSGPPPNDYLVLAAFTILCCFWPLGLVALIKSIETRTKLREGRYDDAAKASKESKMFSLIGIVVGIITLVFSLVLVAIVAAVQLAVVIPSITSQSP